MIVITTPTGQIGSKVLARALDSAEQIRVVAREPARLDPRTRDRVEIIQGSLADGDVVAKAFAGADAVFYLVPPNSSAETVAGHVMDFARPACDAIVSQGVKRVVGLSTLGRGVARHAGQISAALAVDGLIETTGVHYRSVCPPTFMENILLQVEPLRHQGTFFLPAAGDRKIPTIATRDIAAVAADLLLDDSWTGQDSVPVLGPEDVSFNDMAEIMTEVLGRPIRYQQIPGEAYKATLTSFGMSDGYAQGLVDMWGQIDTGVYNVEPRTPEASTPTTFRQWCQDVLEPVMS
jgi:uncharacterized protein YbjT (DUF2867 family)